MPFSPPVKVLHLAAAESMIFPILRDQLVALREAGYEVHAACIDGPLGRRITEDGFAWTPVPLTRAFAPWADWKARCWLENYFRQQRFEIVHTHTPKANVVGQWAARRAGVPIVLQTLHGFYFHERMPWWKRKLWARIERFSASHSDHILCQNPEDVQTALRERIAPQERLTLLGNGIDLARFRPDVLNADERKAYRLKLGLPEGALVAGMCGRFVAEKGFPEFLAAGQALLEKFPALHLLAVGHQLASERKRERWSPEDAGLPAHKLTVLQDRDDMPQVYACMDLHVLPSHREGFPRVLMEGAAMGLAQVATNIRGCRQTIAEGETGFLVPVGNVTALSERMARLLGAAELRQSMGRSARAQAEKEFDQRRVFQTVTETYARLIHEKKLRRT